MLCLQHRGEEGVAEAFRFTMPPASAASATHGTRQSARRISWLAGRVIEGTATGRAVDLDEFRAELDEAYAPLCGCATWRFASPLETDLRVPGNEHKKPSAAAGGRPFSRNWRVESGSPWMYSMAINISPWNSPSS